VEGQAADPSVGHIYNQSLVGSLLAADGPEKTETWAKGVAANMRGRRAAATATRSRASRPRSRDRRRQHLLYVNLMRSKKPEDREVAAKCGVVFPNQSNRGTHVNISGGAVARYAPNKAVAIKFLEYLVSPQAQKYFAEGNSEYPVIAGVELSAELKSLGAFKEDQLNARVFAQNNARRSRSWTGRAGNSFFRTAGLRPAHDHDAGRRPAVQKSMTCFTVGEL